MKINVVKLILALGFGALSGLLCYVLAKENLTSFIVTAVSMFICMASVFGFDYNYGNRNVNIKTAACTFTVIAFFVNIMFCFFINSTLMYLALIGFVILLDIATVYSLCKPGSK